VQGWMSLLWFERPGSDIAFSRGSGYVSQSPSDEPASTDHPAIPSRNPER